MAVLTSFLDDDFENSLGLKPVLDVYSRGEFLTIKIGYADIDDSAEARIISLNKKSAIKLAKELRKQISFLED